MGNERELPAEQGNTRGNHDAGVECNQQENYLRISGHGAIFKFENKSETKRGRCSGRTRGKRAVGGTRRC